MIFKDKFERYKIVSKEERVKRLRKTISQLKGLSKFKKAREEFIEELKGLENGKRKT